MGFPNFESFEIFAYVYTTNLGIAFYYHKMHLILVPQLDPKKHEYVTKTCKKCRPENVRKNTSSCQNCYLLLRRKVWLQKSYSILLLSVESLLSRVLLTMLIKQIGFATYCEILCCCSTLMCKQHGQTVIGWNKKHFCFYHFCNFCVVADERKNTD